MGDELTTVHRLSRGTTITSNVPGFSLLNGAELAESMVEAGLMTREDADAALERRRQRIAASPATTDPTS